MKRLILVAATLATITAPMMASAQNRELNRDRRELQQDRRDATRDGVITRGEQRELNRDRRELRSDSRDARNDRRERRWDRNDRNWWRGRSDFRDYNGVRSGFWYAPGYGYYSVDPRYARYSWRRGAVVPRAYRNRVVVDPYVYGLRPAGRGQRWVYVDNNLVLMSIASGVIADIVSGAF
ncbi:MAG: RcnB family protein [Caulobacteraceae bacterium]